MLILNASDVAKCLSHKDCIDVLDAAMRSVSQRDVVIPLRQWMAVPGSNGKLGLMPGYLGAPRSFGVKIVSKYPRTPDSPYGSHAGGILLFDAEEGIPVALLDGSEVTAIRTAAASALATHVLARKDAKTLAILGTGLQARHHIAAIQCIRSVEHVLIWGRNRDRAAAFLDKLNAPATIKRECVDHPEDAVSCADIVCTVTSSQTPILMGSWLRPGTHVNLVGAAVRSSAEADNDVVARSKFFVDHLDSAMEQAGELLNAIEQGRITQSHVAGEIGQVLDGAIAGRAEDSDITVYKSLGIAAQDLAASYHAVERARAAGLGTTVDWN